MFGDVILHATFLLLSFSIDARDITFPSVSGIERLQQPVTNDDGVDIITGSDFSGLMTFANLPYANCFTASDISAYDIAILGAPFDTVSLAPNMHSQYRGRKDDQNACPCVSKHSNVKERSIAIGKGCMG